MADHYSGGNPAAGCGMMILAGLIVATILLVGAVAILAVGPHVPVLR